MSTVSPITRLPAASTLVYGEFVEYRPRHFIRAGAVQLVVALGKDDDGCLLSCHYGEQECPLSPYPVHLVLTALNLALAQGRERLVSKPEY